MDKEKFWKRFQEHMNYTDEEMEIFRANPEKVKMVTETPDFVKCRIIAEVIESQGCHAQHRVGDKIIMDGNGQTITKECPDKMCIFALAALMSPVNKIYERFLDHADPKHERFNVVQCSDIGLEKGGWGKILMKVYVEGPDMSA